MLNFALTPVSVVQKIAEPFGVHCATARNECAGARPVPVFTTQETIDAAARKVYEAYPNILRALGL